MASSIIIIILLSLKNLIFNNQIHDRSLSTNLRYKSVASSIIIIILLSLKNLTFNNQIHDRSLSTNLRRTLNINYTFSQNISATGQYLSKSIS